MRSSRWPSRSPMLRFGAHSGRTHGGPGCWYPRARSLLSTVITQQSWGWYLLPPSYGSGRKRQGEAKDGSGMEGLC